MPNRPHPVPRDERRPQEVPGATSSHDTSDESTRYFRGITLIQFMFILVFAGIAAFWIVEFLRGRAG